MNPVTISLALPDESLTLSAGEKVEAANIEARILVLGVSVCFHAITPALVPFVDSDTTFADAAISADTRVTDATLDPGVHSKPTALAGVSSFRNATR